jgi:hypothetical protein
MNPNWTTLRLPDGKLIDFDANRVMAISADTMAIWTHVGWMLLNADDLPSEYLPKECNADSG